MILLYAYLCVEKLACVYDLEMRVRGFQNIYRVSMISNISWNCPRFQRSGTHGKQINANMANMISLYLNFYLREGFKKSKLKFKMAFAIRRPTPPFMANAILNFHFDFLHTSLKEATVAGVASELLTQI